MSGRAAQVFAAGFTVGLKVTGVIVGDLTEEPAGQVNVWAKDTEILHATTSTKKSFFIEMTICTNIPNIWLI